MGFEAKIIPRRKRSSFASRVGVPFLWLIAVGLLFPSILSAEPTLDAVPQLTVTWHPGVCAGGIHPGSVCFSDFDCPGGCVGGDAPGAECVFSQYGYPNFGACPGACSRIPHFHCDLNAECTGVGGGTCTAPPPGTCGNPTPGVCQGGYQLSWSEVSGDASYDLVIGDLGYVHDAGILGGYCQAYDTIARFWLLDPEDVSPGTTFFLVRASHGTYDEGGNQAGSRDFLTACNN